MREQFVTCEIALKLKELGFNEKCFALFDAYNENNLVYLSDGKNKMGNIMLNSSMDYSCTAPLWQQALDFLSKTYEIDITFNINDSPTIIKLFRFTISHYRRLLLLVPYFSRYEFINKHEAREQAILKAIELIENNM